VTSDDGFEQAGGLPVHGRPADPFGAPHEADDSRPGDPYREIPIGVPDTPEGYEERKRAAERPDRSESGGDAQIDYGDGGSES
jgi:hypothetical protein